MVSSSAAPLPEAAGGSLRAAEVVRTFLDPAGNPIHALGPADLEIEAGEFVSILGPSGCGKSTLLRLLAGLDAPTSGSLMLDGEAIAGPHHERGLVFQDPTLFPWLTARRNVAFGLIATNSLREREAEIDEYLRLVGLENFQRSYPHQLSGGMAQRVALARALVNHPKVLLLDEPLGALDAFTRMQMQDELLRIWEDRGTTMLLVTHDIDEALYMSDRIVIMSPPPGTIQEVIPVPLSRPRARNDPDFLRLRSRILEILHFAKEPAPLSYYL